MDKILLIDDDEMTLMFMRRLLDEAGFSVVATADGPHGIALFKEHFPDLVLLDVGLPGMSGMQVLRELREIDPQAVIVIITGYKSSVTMQQAMEDGAKDFIVKPIEPGRLLNKVHQLLSQTGR